jgi:hypothetical protein
MFILTVTNIDIAYVSAGLGISDWKSNSLKKLSNPKLSNGFPSILAIQELFEQKVGKVNPKESGDKIHFGWTAQDGRISEFRGYSPPVGPMNIFGSIFCIARGNIVIRKAVSFFQLEHETTSSKRR